MSPPIQRVHHALKRFICMSFLEHQTALPALTFDPILVSPFDFKVIALTYQFANQCYAVVVLEFS